MPGNPASDPSSKRPRGRPRRDSGPTTTFWYLMLLGVLIAVAISLYRGNLRGTELTFGQFTAGINSDKYNSSNVHGLTISPHLITFQNQPLTTASLGQPSTAKTAEPATPTDTPAPSAEKAATRELERFHIQVEGLRDDSADRLAQLLESKGIDYRYSTPATRWEALIYLLMTLVLVLAFIMFFRRMGGAGSPMSFARSRGRLYAEEGLKITFDDAAGIEEAVEELREIVEFLRTPGKYQALGGRIPRGVLLVGPPGTGKTLLAKAVAGEAGVPFFSLSGSDFVEMFVGVGAARVRDMFAQAVQKSPSIIFIDELDALGKTRGSGLPGGHDERDQTLNALLVEMDGFSSDQSVIVMGATNRPETLDPALLRPGRFDRHVLVDRPDYKGREAILKVHSVKIKMDDDVNLGRLAKLTPGFVGADLANLVNEAALLAARKNKSAVSMAEFEEAIERVIAGLEKTSRIIHEDEKQRVAYHECGHALVACSLPHTDPVHKISIIPRGFGALGYMLQRPEDDRHLVTQSELENRICVALGGIAAEDVVYQETSTGAQNDLERATDIARRMVTEFGMSPKLGRMNYHEQRRGLFLGGSSAQPAEHAHSEATIREVDLEVKRIIDECMQTARDVLLNRRPVLEQITAALIESEVMDGEQLQRILDAHKTTPQIMPGTFIEKPAGRELPPAPEVERREAVEGA
ncbi:MAG: ATP-dependent zinc metalloprotease FtsH [Planctomycetaceae bacterium]|nr:ATP-dependent zinc metalloprotease FtsH [Planctomycetaceae bacterium]